MDKKRIKLYTFIILIAIVGIFGLAKINTEVKYANAIKPGKGELVKDYNTFFTAENIINVYQKYIIEDNIKNIEYISDKHLSLNQYKKMKEKVNLNILKVDLKYVYLIDKDTYRCEFNLVPNYEETSDASEEIKEELKKYENGINNNYMAIKIDTEKKQFKVLNSKFNI